MHEYLLRFSAVYNNQETQDKIIGYSERYNDEIEMRVNICNETLTGKIIVTNRSCKRKLHAAHGTALLYPCEEDTEQTK